MSEPAADASFPIEELARRTGMTVRTLRAYQSRKLLPADIMGVLLPAEEVPLIRRETMCLGNRHPDYLGETQGLAPGEYPLPPVGLNLTCLQPV